MDEKNSLKKSITQLRERLLNLKSVDSSIIQQYIVLESQFKELFPQISFKDFRPITHLSKFERFGNVEYAFNRRFNPILNCLEHMISNYPEEIIDKELIFFWKLIDRNIIAVSQTLFNNGHYADSVLAAFKEVNNRVKHIAKNKAGSELDGKKLMLTTFSVNNPIIALDDDLSSQTGKDIQEGYMHIYAGSMQGIRNPKAHKNLKIDKKRAIHFLSLASLLMDKLDERGL